VSWVPRLALLAAVAFALAGPGCGGEADARDPLTVSAAASLSEAFAAYAEGTDAKERLTFGGSDELAAQIRTGAPVDVFASAGPAVTDALRAEGLIEPPVLLARNEVVLAVRKDSALLDPPVSLGEDATRLAGVEDVAVVIGAEGVPVGDYTRRVLGGLPARQHQAILGKVRSEEFDVKGIVAKLLAGAADAGFVYRTDVVAAEEDLIAIPMPRRLHPSTELTVAVVVDSERRAEAQAFIAGLAGGTGADELRRAGFELP
jgi:molybdate transport system substrate-binding protein